MIRYVWQTIKKPKAIYVMPKDEINEEVEWWKDNAFVAELDSHHEAWAKGQEKGFTLEEIDAAFEQLRKKCKEK
jgi:hypothetical protein